MSIDHVVDFVVGLGSESGHVTAEVVGVCVSHVLCYVGLDVVFVVGFELDSARL